MPKINQILEKTKKRLDLTSFFGEETYITIKKLSLLQLRKLNYLSLGTLNSKIGKEIYKRMDAEGNINKEETAKILTEMELDEETASRLDKNTNEMERLIFNNGIDEYDHNFTDADNKKIALNYDTLIQFANEDLMKHILDEIKGFSGSFTLGEQIATV